MVQCAYLRGTRWQWVVLAQDLPQLLQPGVECSLIPRGVLQEATGRCSETLASHSVHAGHVVGLLLPPCGGVQGDLSHLTERVAVTVMACGCRTMCEWTGEPEGPEAGTMMRVCINPKPIICWCCASCNLDSCHPAMCLDHLVVPQPPLQQRHGAQCCKPPVQLLCCHLQMQWVRQLLWALTNQPAMHQW